MKLFFRELGQGSPIVIMHGLFGASDNWLSQGKVLAEDHKVYLLDLRNHGQSPHDNAHNYKVMAEDLEEFLTDQQIKNPVIIGHSMGGKTAMTFAAMHPELFDKLIVVDIAPKTYGVHHDTILDGLNAIDLTTLTSRNQAEEQLALFVPDLGTRQFLLKNLARNKDGGFEWKLNLAIISANIETIGQGMEKGLTKPKPVLFIRGRNSNYIKDSDFDKIKSLFPGAQIETVENAGHWVHAEQPQELLRLVKEFIN